MTVSCTDESFCESIDKPATIKLQKMKTRSVIDTIVPFEGERSLQRNRTLLPGGPYEEIQRIHDEIYDLRELPIYITVKENPRGGLFLTSKGAGKELIMADYKNDDSQKFYVKVLPASTGIPYLIYSYKEDKPISVGHYKSDPSTYVLYTLNSTSGNFYGASWDFSFGKNIENSYVIQNQDIKGGGPNYWDMYELVIGSNINKTQMAKYMRLATQEFEFRPVEEFTIQSIEYVNDATATLSQKPYKVIRDGYVNAGDIQQTYTLQLSEEVSETSSHNKKTSASFSINTESKVSVPLVAEGKISVTAASSREFSYGTSQSTKRTILRSHPIIIPARHKALIEITLFENSIDLDYIATCRGNSSNRIIKIKGRWHGVSISESQAILHLTSIDNPKETKSYRLSKNIKRWIQI